MVVGPGYQGKAKVSTAQGDTVAELDLTESARSTVYLPPGDYRIDLPEADAESFSVEPGGRVRFGEDPPPPVIELAPPAEGPTPPKASERAPSPAPARTGAGDLPRSTQRKAAASVVVPGLGQMLQGQGPKGAGILIGSLGLVAASLLSRRPPADPTRRDLLSEGARLGGFGLATGALGMLYAGQVMDSFAVARGRRAQADPRWRFRFEAQRMFSLRFSPTPGGVDYLRDWSISLLGQPAPRVFVGASDLSVHVDSPGGANTLQAGLRAGYRVVERKALWLNLSGGVLGQFSFSDNPRYGDPDAGPQSPSSIDASATFFAQSELQWFIVDRWSLNLTPRFYVPVGTRRFGRDLAVPSGAPSFELGTGVGAQF